METEQNYIQAMRDEAQRQRELITKLRAQNTELLAALEGAEAVNEHRHFCEQCLPARGCGDFYRLHSRAAALRVATIKAEPAPRT